MVENDFDMAISDDDIDEFIEIYAADFGERLLRDDTLVFADRLMLSESASL